MKKIKTLLLALTAMLLTPGLHAQKYVIGPVIDISEAADGLEVVFEGRTDNTNKLGYLGMPNSSSKLVRFEGDEVPENIVWVLCAVDSTNSVTGDPMFNLKNKATGEFIGSNWSAGSYNRFFAVKDQAEAAPFCIKYASDPTYGGVNSGSFDSGDWLNDPSTVTICQIDASITNGALFIANEANEGVCGFFEWRDTNIWSMHSYEALTSGKDFLNQLLLTIPTDWQSTYQVGTEPGSVNDAEKYQRFFELWDSALANLDSWSEEQCTTTYNELNELWTWIQSSESQVPIEDGGYYYFFTANNDFVGKDNGNFAIYAPEQSNTGVIGWKAFDENDPTFIWKVNVARVAENGTVYYSVQNMGSRLYIGQGTSKADGQPIEWTDEYSYPTLFISLDHTGQWQISDYRDWTEYPPRPFHQDNHQSGAGTSGRIVLYNGGIGTASAWLIKKVPQEKVDMLEGMKSRIELANYWAHNGKLATSVGDSISNTPGFISNQEVLDNYRAADAAADTMLHYSADKTYTEAEWAAAYEALKSSTEAFVADRDRGLADGYYRIKVQQAVYKYNDPNMYLNIVNGRPGWSRVDEGYSLNHIWKIEKVDGVEYNVQNMGNGKYIYKGDTPTSGAYIGFSDTPETAQLIRPFDVMNGQFYISNVDDSNLFYDTGDHDNGTSSSSALKYWTGHDVDGGTAWVFEPVSAEEYAAIEAANAQTNLNYELKNSLSTAKRLYNQNTTYTYGDKIITDKSEIFSNNNSVNEGQHLENLIDGNTSTYWNSAWDTETNPAETHYIRFQTSDPAGWPDSVAFYFEVRNDASWHRAPSKLRVSVSNDTITWNEVRPVLEQGDITARDLNAYSTDPIYVLLNDISGYKYVRFEFLACKPNYQFNNHPVCEFSEANIVPVTGVDEENSVTCTEKYKAISAELFAAIQQGQTEFDKNQATQATVDLLNSAINGFNNISVADSIIAMTNLNLANFTEGDNVGDFPGEALDAYSEEAYEALDNYDLAEVKTSEVTNAVVNDLTAAYNKLYAQMNMPEPNKWYVLQLTDASTPDRLINVMKAGGWYGHNPGSSYSYWLTNGDIETVAEDERTHFMFTANEDGTYDIQCVGSGFFNGPETGSGNATYDYRPIQWYEPNPVTIVPFGDGQIGLRLKSGRYFYQNPGWLNYGMEYQPMNTTQGKDSKYSWKIQRSSDLVGDAITNVQSIAQGRVIAITKPYALYGLPQTEDGTLQGYKVVGVVTAENTADSIVTGYQLQKLADEEIPAGYPVVYIAPGDNYDANVTVNATFSGIVDTKVTNVADTVNGLAGTIDQMATPVDHYGYFLEDSVVDEPANTTIGYQRAVLIPWLVENLAGSDPSVQVDKIVYVKGSGMLNGINDVIVEDQAEKVDVYSIDGVLLRRNVARANATDGLAKGIYIVGKDKVLVK